MEAGDEGAQLHGVMMEMQLVLTEWVMMKLVVAQLCGVGRNGVSAAWRQAMMGVQLHGGW